MSENGFELLSDDEIQMLDKNVCPACNTAIEFIRADDSPTMLIANCSGCGAVIQLKKATQKEIDILKNLGVDTDTDN